MQIFGMYFLKGSTSHEIQIGRLLIQRCFLTGGLWDHGLIRWSVDWVSDVRPWKTLYPPEQLMIKNHQEAAARWELSQGRAWGR